MTIQCFHGLVVSIAWFALHEHRPYTYWSVLLNSHFTNTRLEVTGQLRSSHTSLARSLVSSAQFVYKFFTSCIPWSDLLNSHITYIRHVHWSVLLNSHFAYTGLVDAGRFRLTHTLLTHLQWLREFYEVPLHGFAVVQVHLQALHL